MAATVVQSQLFNDATAETPSKVFTPASPTVDGNTLVVVVGCNTKTRTPTGILDSASNAGWVVVDGGGASGVGSAFILVCPNAASISSFQVEFSGTTKCQVVFYEVAGLAGTVNAHHTTPYSAVTTSPSDSVTTTDACLIIIAEGGSSAATAIGGGFSTGLDSNTGGGVGIILSTAHQEFDAAGAHGGTFTQPSDTCQTVIVALDVAAGTVVDGSASGVTAFAGSATGSVEKDGTAAGGVVFSGAATGTVEVHGSAMGVTAFTGAATGGSGGPEVDGSASGVTAFSGAATGTVEFDGSAAGATVFTGHATGTVEVHGSASGVTVFGGSAIVGVPATPGWLLEIGWDRGGGLFTLGKSVLAASSSAPSATLLASGQQAGAAGDVTATLAAGAPVDSLVVSIMSWAAKAAVPRATTVTDSKGNVHTVYPNTSQNPSHAILISRLSAALAVGDTITLPLVSGQTGLAANVGGRMFSVASYGTGMEVAAVDQVSMGGSLDNPFAATTGQLDQAVERAILIASVDTGQSGSSFSTPAGWTSRDSIEHSGLPTKYLAWWDRGTADAAPLTPSVTVSGVASGPVESVSLITLRVTASALNGDVLAGPYSDPTWSVVKGVQTATINRGRQDSMAAVQAGELDVTIVDTDGTFNPKNSSSPLFGKLKPRRFGRLGYGWDNGDGTVTPIYLYRGYIREIQGPQSRQSPYATITFIDALEELSTLKPVIAPTGPTTTGGAITAILNAIDYPSTLRDVAVGDPIPDFSMDGTVDALAMIGSLLAAELGEFHIAADGTATYIDHGGRLSRSGTVSSTSLLSPGVSLETVVTQATVIRADSQGNALGQPQTYQDGSAVQDYNVRVPSSDPLQTPFVSSDAQALDLATRMVTLWKDPRSPVWTLQLKYRPDDLATYREMLSRDLGDRIAVNDPATGGGGDYTIEGIQHQVDQGGLDHVATWALLERPTGVFVIGQSLIGSLDTLAV